MGRRWTLRMNLGREHERSHIVRRCLDGESTILVSIGFSACHEKTYGIFLPNSIVGGWQRI